jgi:ribosomal protein L29
MKMTELQKKSDADLKKMIGEKRDELRSFRFGEAGSRTRNVRVGRALRRNIARILTELRQREIKASHQHALEDGLAKASK